MSRRVKAIIAHLGAERGVESDSQIALRFGVGRTAIKDIRRRYGIAPTSRVGRPQLAVELTADQQRVVVEHMTYARGVARRCCRDKSLFFEADVDDYIGCGYLGLVKAASRWRGSGSFKALCAKYIEGTITDYRRREMAAQGWGKRSQREGMRRVAQIAAWPRSRKTGRRVDPKSLVVQPGHEGASCVQLLAAAFGK